jgi:uncharacterized protein YukE
VRLHEEVLDVREVPQEGERRALGLGLPQPQHAEVREAGQHVEARREPQIELQVFDVLEPRQPPETRVHLATVGTQPDVRVTLEHVGRGSQHGVGQRHVELQPQRPRCSGDRRLDGRRVRAGLQLAEPALDAQRRPHVSSLGSWDGSHAGRWDPGLSKARSGPATIDGTMGDELHGIEEDVRFNWDGAASLERELRSTANTLDSQIPRRNGYASAAREEWRGVYSREFRSRMEICTGDAGRLSSAMELAANQVRELAEAARREQDRREKAREWKREQDNEGILDKAGDFLFGEDDKPPIPPPEPPPRFVTTAPARGRT